MIKRHPLVIFTMLTFGLTWSVWMPRRRGIVSPLDPSSGAWSGPSTGSDRIGDHLRTSQPRRWHQTVHVLLVVAKANKATSAGCSSRRRGPMPASSGTQPGRSSMWATPIADPTYGCRLLSHSTWPHLFRRTQALVICTSPIQP